MLSKALKIQAGTFTALIGVVSFSLAWWVSKTAEAHHYSEGIAFIFAVSLAVLVWGAVNRLISPITDAAQAAESRLASAAKGDLDTPMPAIVSEAMPRLSRSLEGFFADVRRNIESANSLALFDAVTSLPNRVHFRNEASTMIEQMPPSAVSALYFIDLDHFKAVNDNLGHAAGDQLLILVANRMREVIAASAFKQPMSEFTAIPGRLAGDEFTIFLPEARTRKAAEMLATDLIAALNRPFSIAGQQVEIGASIGVAMRPDHGHELTHLMRAADVAMYQAKSTGRGKACFYGVELAAQLAKRERLDQDLKLALINGEFKFVYQPQIDMRTGQIISAESLMRWIHPIDGLRLPQSFLPVAEENGLMDELGEWAISAMAETAARWQSDQTRYRISNNFTHRELSRPSIGAKFMSALAQYGGSLDQCEFEINEQLAMNLTETMLSELSLLRSSGATITIDNFGKGASSITKLRELPVDRVKLDPALIQDLEQDAEARVIVQGLIGIVHGIGRQVIAQGVETREQYQILKVMGCDAVQGFGIAKPMSETDLTRWSWSPPAVTKPRARPIPIS